MNTYCQRRVVEMFGAQWDAQEAEWWVWMFGCVEPCTFCESHGGKQ